MNGLLFLCGAFANCSYFIHLYSPSGRFLKAFQTKHKHFHKILASSNLMAIKILDIFNVSIFFISWIFFSFDYVFQHFKIFLDCFLFCSSNKTKIKLNHIYCAMTLFLISTSEEKMWLKWTRICDQCIWSHLLQLKCP